MSPCEDLSHPAVLSEAKRDNGLGNSYRAEVAYWGRCDVAYEDYDVMEIYAFMSRHMKKKKVPQIGVTSKRTRVLRKAYHNRICSSLRLLKPQTLNPTSSLRLQTTGRWGFRDYDPGLAGRLEAASLPSNFKLSVFRV